MNKSSLSSKDFRIRPVEKRDLDQLVQLCADHADFEGCFYSKQGKASALEVALWSDALDYKCFVVDLQGRLMGYVTLMKQFSTWSASYYMYMDCLYLVPEVRNKGLGRRLMAKVVQYTRSQRCREVQWQTPLGNVGAIKFYEREGAVSKAKARFFLDVHAWE